MFLAVLHFLPVIWGLELAKKVREPDSLCRPKVWSTSNKMAPSYDQATEKSSRLAKQRELQRERSRINVLLGRVTRPVYVSSGPHSESVDNPLTSCYLKQCRSASDTYQHIMQ